MKKILFLIMISFFILSLQAEFSFAQPMNQDLIECQPTYGHYWRGDKWGRYGARRVVRTPVEARDILEKFFMSRRGIKVGRIRERAWFFEAEIINKKGIVIDSVLIDKRTGRIRSIF